MKHKKYDFSKRPYDTWKDHKPVPGDTVTCGALWKGIIFRVGKSRCWFQDERTGERRGFIWCHHSGLNGNFDWPTKPGVGKPKVRRKKKVVS